MRLVMTYGYGDGCTWHYDAVVPFKYLGPEEAIVDFEWAVIQAAIKKQETFSFNEADFTLGHFFFTSLEGEEVINLPEIFTLEEWHEKNCK